MPPKKKKLSREEILAKKRQAERLRYERKKNDPQNCEEMKEKERLKYQKKKERGLRKSVKDMTPREHRAALAKWKEYCSVYRAKRMRMNTIANTFKRQNTAVSDLEDIPSSKQLSPNSIQVTLKPENTPLSDFEEDIPSTRQLSPNSIQVTLKLENMPLSDFEEDMPSSSQLTPDTIKVSPTLSQGTKMSSITSQQRKKQKRRRKYNKERNEESGKHDIYRKRLTRFETEKKFEDTLKKKLLKMVNESLGV